MVENTPTVHNLVVCTLCSCYPGNFLGLPPVWYKSFAYRSRAVIEPRAVLREFGLDLDPSVEVRVWDSSSELRYLVLPERPAGTEGLTEAELADAGHARRDDRRGAGRPARSGGVGGSERRPRFVVPAARGAHSTRAQSVRRRHPGVRATPAPARAWA